MKNLILLTFLVTGLTAFAQDEGLVPIEQVTLKTKEYRQLAKAEADLKAQLDAYHKKHEGKQLAVGEPEAHTREESDTIKYKKYKYKKNGSKKYKKKLKVRFRPALIIDKCRGNTIQFPIKFYTQNNGLKGGKTATKDVLVEYHTLTVDVAVFEPEIEKEPMEIKAQIDAKFPSCLVEVDEISNASSVKSQLDDIAAKLANWMKENKTGSCSMKVTGKASFTNITTSCAKKINKLAGSDFPTDKQVSDKESLLDMNKVLAAKRGENTSVYLLKKIEAATQNSHVDLMAQADEEVIGTPSGEKVEADSKEALAKQMMDVTVSCK